MTDREAMNEAWAKEVVKNPHTAYNSWCRGYEAALAQPEHRFDAPESHIVKWSIPVDPNNFGEPLAQAEHPLDKKADNARELGLDYEPDMSTNQQNVNTSEERVHKSDKSIHEMQRLGQELEQEPVAWMLPDYSDVLSASEADGTGIYNIPLYTAPQKYCPSENNAAYEKGFVEGMAKQMHSSVDRAVNAMAKPWVGLTDEEISEVLGSDIYQEQSGELRFIRAIEAKLKEKNT